MQQETPKFLITIKETCCHVGYCALATLTARGSYHSGPNPAAFLAASLKGGFKGPLKYVLTIA
jgi:hypothetical protein